MSCSALCSLLLAAAPAAATPRIQSPPPPELDTRLAELVALPTAAERKRRARELAQDHTVGVDEWRAAIRAFSSYPAYPPGVGSERATLDVGGQKEETELAVYVPPGYDPAQASPMLLLLHGSSDRGGSMIRMWRKVADQAGLLLLAPTDPHAANGYTFAERERLAALAALRWFRLHYHVDPRRIHLSGVSRGAHLGWDLATRYPDRWASFAPLIGGPSVTITGGRNNLRLVENLLPIPLRCLQGAKDDPRLIRNQKLAFARLQAGGASDAQLLLFPELEHDFDFDAVDWPSFFQAAARDPLPKHLSLRAVRLPEARSNWLRILRFDRKVREEFRPEIQASAWKAARSEDARLRLIQAQVDQRTAQVDAEWLGQGRFEIHGKGVRKLRLSLSAKMLGPGGRIQVEYDGRTRKFKPKPSTALLLEDFAERLDPAFLPVATVDLP